MAHLFLLNPKPKLSSNLMPQGKNSQELRKMKGACRGKAGLKCTNQSSDLNVGKPFSSLFHWTRVEIEKRATWATNRCKSLIVNRICVFSCGLHSGYNEPGLQLVSQNNPE